MHRMNNTCSLVFSNCVNYACRIRLKRHLKARPNDNPSDSSCFPSKEVLPSHPFSFQSQKHSRIHKLRFAEPLPNCWDLRYPWRDNKYCLACATPLRCIGQYLTSVRFPYRQPLFDRSCGTLACPDLCWCLISAG